MSVENEHYKIIIHVSPEIDMKTLKKSPTAKMLMRAEARKVIDFLRTEKILSPRGGVIVEFSSLDLGQEIEYPFVEFNGNCYLVNLKPTS